METAVGEVSLVVTGGGLRRRANNNLDVVDFAGRRYLAWRSAPSHLASRHARILVASSEDGGRSWRLEHEIALGRDVREPRLFDFRGRLQLFFFTAGTRWHRFAPDRIHVSLLEADGWGEPVAVSAEDHVVWRVRWLGERPAMTVYRGARALSSDDPRPPTVELWTTEDGVRWFPMPGLEPPFDTGTETDVLELADGTVVAVTRMDGPDRFGSGIAVRPPGSGEWRRRTIPHKLDSPLLFEHRGEVMLIARRSLGFGGRFDLAIPIRRPSTQMRLYQAAYASSRKRTSLWRIDRNTCSARFVADLPGRGDTCFPAVVEEGDDRVRVFNYSSALDGPDRPWLVGMLGPTSIYDTVITITGQPGTMFSGGVLAEGAG